ncbi:MAG TPA: N-acetylmuramoyl-L-alanine amidase [Geminicoccaceae bacterium]|nr:N-acetylmuramoyl-L-alanine amidase [Geminicoccaceae bacterium]
MRQRWSPNADNRPSGSAIDALILHYTGMPSAAAAVNRLCDPAAKVSAHYLIDEDGSVVQLVPEERRAWHAGVSEWQGRPGLNDCSIGIELVNPGHEWGYRPFTEAQYEACIALCRAILERWPIPPGRVLAHSDVAPARKQDPGELFDWSRLAAAGIGLWPEPGAGAPRSVARLQHDLARVGYGVAPSGRLDEATRLVIAAFQRRFRPGRVDGRPDRATLARLDGLLALLQVLEKAPSKGDI